MKFVCCSSHLHFPEVTLHLGDIIELTDVEGEELAMNGKPLVPVDLVDFPADEEVSSELLANAYAEYRVMLGYSEFAQVRAGMAQESQEKEKEN